VPADLAAAVEDEVVERLSADEHDALVTAAHVGSVTARLASGRIRAMTLADPAQLVDVDALIGAYYDHRPDPAVPSSA
jgi:hypothetical protein